MAKSRLDNLGDYGVATKEMKKFGSVNKYRMRDVKNGFKLGATTAGSIIFGITSIFVNHHNRKKAKEYQLQYEHDKKLKKDYESSIEESKRFLEEAKRREEEIKRKYIYTAGVSDNEKQDGD